MHIERITDPSLAQEMSDINHAAFGYKQMRNLTKYQIQKRMTSLRYKAYGLMDGKYVSGFLFVNYLPNDFIIKSGEKRIEDFSVLPWLQSNGVGKAILNYVVNVLHPNASFNLCVNINSKAVFLYEKLGFVSYGQSYMTENDNFIAMGLIRMGLIREEDTYENKGLYLPHGD